MRRALAAVAVVGIVGAPALAAAMCGPSPVPRISPPDGAHLPVNPHVYLFLAEDAWPPMDQVLRITQGDRPVPFRAVALGATPAGIAVRIDITTSVIAPLTIVYGYSDRGEEVAGYPIDPAPAHDTALVIAAEPAERGALALDLASTAVAYRLEWARTARELATSPTGHAWLWPQPADPDLRAAAGGYAAPDRVLIGPDHCRGSSVPGGAFDEPHATRLVAVFADGREASIDTGVMQLGRFATIVPAIPWHTVAPAPTVPPAGATPAPPILIAIAPAWRSLIAAGIVGACACLAIVLALAWRQRRQKHGALGT
jgi:hypothetical protein